VWCDGSGKKSLYRHLSQVIFHALIHHSNHWNILSCPVYEKVGVRFIKRKKKTHDYGCWLVTGGLGFLGTHLLNLLENEDVTVLDLAQPRAPKEHVKYLWQTVGDLSPEILREYDYIVHLAAVTDVPLL